ncbi:MAG: UDP-N-acetylmuramate dehydrogenase [Tyzzerella sp.]|nr:UDP-N-acetylmuramate dehydrogenase [Tyzzerella sp.]
MNLIFDDKIMNMIDATRIYREEPMKKHTTFRVGGNADYFIVPKTTEEVKNVVTLCKETDMPYYILGNGSNLLVSDKGYQGVIIQIYKEMNEIFIEGDQIKVQAGALLSKIGSAALESGLTGFEFASGIPGTIGGAVVMNAGAYGGEMKDVLEEVTVLTPEGEVIVLQKEELELGYRTSIIAKKDYIVLEAKLKLEKGDRDAIKAKMDELKLQRTTKQPLEYPSAGSTFKRPEGYFAGKLIQDAGLRGFQVGGAQVSEKHCGFVINKDHATAADVWELMCQVRAIVKEKFGVELEPEVKRLGEF